jgi:hypothetical protein
MFAAAAALARRRALAALAQPQVAQARGMAIVRRSGRAAAADSKAVAPLAPTWQPVKDKETGCAHAAPAVSLPAALRCAALRAHTLVSADADAVADCCR